MATDPMLDLTQDYSINRFTGTGTNGPFEFNFAGGYIRQEHIKAYITNEDGSYTVRTVTFTGPNTVTTDVVIPNGTILTIYRDTPKDGPAVSFTDGAIINEANLDTLAKQAVFTSAEMVDRFGEISITAQDALDTANEAIDDAAAAQASTAAAASSAAASAALAASASSSASAAGVAAASASASATSAQTSATTAQASAATASSLASTANTNASAAVSTANSANSTANSASTAAATAVSTANTAASNASAAVATANTASTNASAAVSTANTASTNASAAVSTANTASTNASAAVITANAASTAASSAVTTANTASATATSALASASALSVGFIGTAAGVASLTIPAGITEIKTTGYSTLGDGGGGTYVRVASQPSHNGKLRSVDRFLPNGTTDNTNGGWWALMVAIPNIKQFGAVCDGTHDDTQAVTDAVAYLPTAGGGIVDVVGNIPTFNILIKRDGIWLRGQGMSRNQQVPTGKYWKPYDPAKPIVQIGDDTGYYSDNRVSDCAMYGNYVGTIGLEFGPGAYRNSWFNVAIQNFTQYCVLYTAGNSYPCLYNRGVDIQLTTGYAAAYTLGLIGADNVNGYCTVNSLTNFDLTGPNGGFGIYAYGQVNQNVWTNGWIQGDNNGGVHAVVSTGGYAPALYGEGVFIDSDTSFTVLALYEGEDLQTAGSPAFKLFQGDFHMDGLCLHSNAKTTGTISASSTSLTVASASNIWAGRTVFIPGAGPSGGHGFSATVTNVSGTTVTLSAAAGTSVTSATVYIGDVPSETFTYNQKMVDATAYKFELSQYTRPHRLAEGRLLYGGGNGTVAPWNTFGVIADLNGAPWDFLTDSGLSRTITSMTRVGTTITVTFSSSHSMAPGALLDIRGANESGFNGIFTVVTAPSTTTVTITSPVSGTTTATGTFLNQIVRRVTLQNSKLSFDAGFNINFKDNLGNDNSVFQQSVTGSNFFISTPNRADGSLVVTGGTNVSTNGRLSVDGGGVRCFQVNGYGSVGIGGNSAATTRGALYIFDSGNDVSVTPTTGINLWYNSVSGGLRWLDASANTVHIQSNAHSVTGSRPTNLLQPCQMHFDTTLGKPIWRNAANTGWVDATGTSV